MKKYSNLSHQLRIAVDIGGTFTDGVATLVSNGLIWVAKPLPRLVILEKLFQI